MRALVIGLCCFATLVSGAIAQPPQLPSDVKPAPNTLPPGQKPNVNVNGPLQPSVKPAASATLPAGAKPNVTIPCSVDPAMRVTLFKTPGRPANALRITVLIVNEGATGTWTSGDNQQTLTKTIIPGTGHRARSIGQFKVMARHTAGPGGEIGNFAGSEFTTTADEMRGLGRIEIRLNYEADITTDGNACNDDKNMANNQVIIAGADVLAFIASTDRRREFGP